MTEQTKMGPPPWSEAPDWAEWLAMVPNGKWRWFNVKPDDTPGGWSVTDGFSLPQYGFLEDAHHRHWTETLEPRHRELEEDNWEDHISPCAMHSYEDEAPTDVTNSAEGILYRARQHMRDRAKTYDQPQGERSMGATVRAFFEITGDGTMDSEERGWLFMELLKCVRSQQGEYRADNYEDATAYAALRGESAAKERA